ncbi:hypothetical protein BD414DRAFT_384140, partial [Trametes punicea]
RLLSLALPPEQLSPNFPTHALLRILSCSAPTLSHLRISYTEPLLAHDPAIAPALARLQHITHLSLSGLGPRGCELVRALSCRLQEAELDFDDAWVAAVTASPAPSQAFAAQHAPSTIIPDLPTGESSGLPTPAPTPATTPAASATAAHVLPDPIPLLAHSMDSLRVLRASNCLIITVADTLRYPTVRELTLRIACVPTVTPLVHTFPGVAEVYVYTPYDGCGVRAMFTHSANPINGGNRGIAHAPLASLLTIDATRKANRTSQLYSSFPPLAYLHGFAPGLYALALTCPVRHVEISAVSPPLGARPRLVAGVAAAASTETEMVKRILGDTRPARVSLTLGHGWWAQMSVNERIKEREALRTLFEPSETDGSNAGGCAGVKELVVRVEEVGRWKDTTRDLAAMLKPLAGTLATFALRWDRTSVPFDRAPPDDDTEDAEVDTTVAAARPSPSSTPTAMTTMTTTTMTTAVASERSEAFARRLAEDLSALRYVCMEIIHDAPPPAPPPQTSSGHSPPSPRRVERRFWRVERQDERWLCLDPLDEQAGLKVLEDQGLSFEDRVRY